MGSLFILGAINKLMVLSKSFKYYLKFSVGIKSFPVALLLNTQQRGDLSTKEHWPIFSKEIGKY